MYIKLTALHVTHHGFESKSFAPWEKNGFSAILIIQMTKSQSFDQSIFISLGSGNKYMSKRSRNHPRVDDDR